MNNRIPLVPREVIQIRREAAARATELRMESENALRAELNKLADETEARIKAFETQRAPLVPPAAKKKGAAK